MGVMGYFQEFDIKMTFKMSLSDDKKVNYVILNDLDLICTDFVPLKAMTIMTHFGMEIFGACMELALYAANTNEFGSKFIFDILMLRGMAGCRAGTQMCQFQDIRDHQVMAMAQ